MILNIIRFVTLTMLTVSTAAMARFYVAKSEMPWGAFIGVLAATACMAGAVVSRWGTPLAWWATPMVLIYSVSAIIGVRRYLRWRL